MEIHTKMIERIDGRTSVFSSALEVGNRMDNVGYGGLGRTSNKV